MDGQNKMKYLMDRICPIPSTSKSTRPTNHLSMRDMLKITRKMNEAVGDETIEQNTDDNESDDESINMETTYDQPKEEEKFKALFDDMRVNFRFDDLKVTDDYVFWSIVINDAIQAVYQVTKEGGNTPVLINLLDGFNPDNKEDNDEIIKRVKAYDNIFFKYWNDELIQK